MVNGLLMVLDVEGSVHRGDAEILLLERSYFGLVYESKPDIVETFEQAVAAEGINGEGIPQASVVGDDLLLEINGNAVAFACGGALEKLVNLFV